MREVELIPRRGWGGEGALGAVLGFGALHRLPVGLGEEVQAPGEKMFEAEQMLSVEEVPTGNSGYLTPAADSNKSIQQQPPLLASQNFVPPLMINPHAPSGSALTPGPAGAPGKKARHRGGPSPSRAFDDMFEEGAKKSQEQDLVPSRKGGAIAPPPRLGASAAGSEKASPGPSPAPTTADDVGLPGDAEAT